MTIEIPEEDYNAIANGIMGSMLQEMNRIANEMAQKYGNGIDSMPVAAGVMTAGIQFLFDHGASEETVRAAFDGCLDAIAAGDCTGAGHA